MMRCSTSTQSTVCPTIQNWQTLLWNQPAGRAHTWSLATALPHMADSDDGIYLSARGTLELMDSPWIAAPPEDLWHGEYEVGGHTFHVHVWGGRHYDEAAFMEAHRKFTEAQMAVFGWLPVPHYHFLYLFPDFQARHGVEHEASTVIAWGWPTA